MSLLSELIQKPEQEINKLLTELEAKTGYQSHDVRLLADVARRQRRKIEQLGLDPDDTTPEELHQALMSRFEQDTARLEAAVGLAPGSTAEDRANKTLQLLGEVVKREETWALKTTAAKKLLQGLPPRKTMKSLHYRSIDSLLKREDICRILLIAEVVESPTWHKSLTAKAAKLEPLCYEPVRPRLLALPDINSGKVAIASSLAGAVALIGAPDLNVLSMALSLLDGLSRLSTNLGASGLASLNPSLRWWADSAHLIAWNGGQPVSFNINDIALNHAAGKNFSAHTSSNAAKNLWTELLKRYQSELPGEVVAAEEVLASGVRKLAPVRELALEYNEV